MRRTCIALGLAWSARCASSSSGTADGGGGVDGPPPIDAAQCGDLPCDGLYVESSGVDSAAGTKAAPMRTISAAVFKAAASNPGLAA